MDTRYFTECCGNSLGRNGNWTPHLNICMKTPFPDCHIHVYFKHHFLVLTFPCVRTRHHFLIVTFMSAFHTLLSYIHTSICLLLIPFSFCNFHVCISITILLCSHFNRNIAGTAFLHTYYVSTANSDFWCSHLNMSIAYKRIFILIYKCPLQIPFSGIHT